MKISLQIVSLSCYLLFSACTNQQDSTTTFTTSMLASYERAVDNLEENTNLALSQSKSWLEDPSRIRFSPIHQFEEQVDADITALQYAISKLQLSVEQGESSSSKLQQSYLQLYTDLERLEQKLNTNYQQFLSQYQTDFSLDDDDFVNKIEHFSSQVTLLDEAWEPTQLNWTNTQFKLMLAKSNLDLATIKNWIINDLSGMYGGRGF